ncbi:hypothetical protein CDL15_Pgr013841 [Punica granatum]|uniref:Uncharacterized protein n=1 Tax=Punica granatum TaxID=22663 RepID=A0A218X6Y9_PUNGR|nr:hypothetical protein CDL15_Pgr013841 [Punica granatum]
MTFRNSTRFPEGRFSGHERLPTSLRDTSTKNRDHNDPRAPHKEPRAPQDIQGTMRKFRSKPLGLPGPTVPDRGQRANDPSRGKRMPKRMSGCTKNNQGPGDTKLRSERPNRAKPTLEAPSHPNVRSYDTWRH